MKLSSLASPRVILLCSVFSVYAAAWLIISWAFYLIGYELSWGTPILLLSFVTLYVALKPGTLASVISWLVSFILMFSTELELGVEIGRVDLFGRKLKDFYVYLIDEENDSKVRVFGIKEIKLGFSLGHRHPVHMSSTPLLCLLVKGTFVNIPESLLKYMGIIRGDDSEKAKQGDGNEGGNMLLDKGDTTKSAPTSRTSSFKRRHVTKAKKHRKNSSSAIIDRLAWLFRLLMIDIDGIMLRTKVKNNTFVFSVSNMMLSCSTEHNEKFDTKDSWTSEDHGRRLSPHCSIEQISISLEPSSSFTKKFTLFSLSKFAFSACVQYRIASMLELYKEWMCSCSLLAKELTLRKATLAIGNGQVDEIQLAKTRPKSDTRLDICDFAIESVGIFVGRHVIDILDLFLVTITDDIQGQGHGSNESNSPRPLKVKLKNQSASPSLRNRSRGNKTVNQDIQSFDKARNSTDEDDSSDAEGETWECKACASTNAATDAACSVCKSRNPDLFMSSGDESDEDFPLDKSYTGDRSGSEKRGKEIFPVECLLSEKILLLPTKFKFALSHFVVSIEGANQQASVIEGGEYVESGTFCAHSSVSIEITRSIETNQVQEPPHFGSQSSDEDGVDFNKREVVRMQGALDNGKITIQKVTSEELLEIHSGVLSSKQMKSASDRSFFFCRSLSFMSELEHCIVHKETNTKADILENKIHSTSTNICNDIHAVIPPGSKKSMPQFSGKNSVDIDSSGLMESEILPVGEWECNNCAQTNQEENTHCLFCNAKYSSSVAITNTTMRSSDNIMFDSLDGAKTVDGASAVSISGGKNVPERHTHEANVNLSIKMLTPSVVIMPSLFSYVLDIQSLLFDRGSTEENEGLESLRSGASVVSSRSGASSVSSRQTSLAQLADGARKAIRSRSKKVASMHSSSNENDSNLQNGQQRKSASVGASKRKKSNSFLSWIDERLGVGFDRSALISVEIQDMSAALKPTRTMHRSHPEMRSFGKSEARFNCKRLSSSFELAHRAPPGVNFHMFSPSKTSKMSKRDQPIQNVSCCFVTRVYDIYLSQRLYPKPLRQRKKSDRSIYSDVGGHHMSQKAKAQGQDNSTSDFTFFKIDQKNFSIISSLEKGAAGPKYTHCHLDNKGAIEIRIAAGQILHLYGLLLEYTYALEMSKDSRTIGESSLNLETRSTASAQYRKNRKREQMTAIKTNYRKKKQAEKKNINVLKMSKRSLVSVAFNSVSVYFYLNKQKLEFSFPSTQLCFASNRRSGRNSSPKPEFMSIARKISFALCAMEANHLSDTEDKQPGNAKLEFIQIDKLEVVQNNDVCINIGTVAVLVDKNLQLGDAITQALQQRKGLRIGILRLKENYLSLSHNLKSNPSTKKAHSVSGASMGSGSRRRARYGKIEYVGSGSTVRGETKEIGNQNNFAIRVKITVGKADVLFRQEKSADTSTKANVGLHGFSHLSGKSKEETSILGKLELESVELGIYWDRNLHQKSKLKELVWELDDCPSETHAARAHKHGFSFLMGCNITELSAKSICLQLRNHANPLVAVSGLSLTSPKKHTELVLAELAKAKSCTTSVTIELETAYEKVVMENCAKCSIPLKWYFQADLSAKSFEVCHGECMTDSINEFVLAIDRILPSSSDKRSPKLGWWDKLRYMYHGMIMLRLEQFKFLMLSKSPWHGETGLLFDMHMATFSNVRDKKSGYPTSAASYDTSEVDRKNVLTLPMGNEEAELDDGVPILDWREFLGPNGEQGGFGVRKDVNIRRKFSSSSNFIDQDGNGADAAQQNESENKQTSTGIWELHCVAFTLSAIENTVHRQIKQFDLLQVPRAKVTLSLCWGQYGDKENSFDHYIQLHHEQIAYNKITDMYKDFRSQGLDLGLKFELSCAPSGYDAENPILHLPEIVKNAYQKNNIPALTFCWAAYDLLYDIYSVLNPPGPGKTPPEKATLPRLLTRLKIGILAEQPAIVWWECHDSEAAILTTAESMVAKLEYVRVQSSDVDESDVNRWKPPYGTPPSWTKYGVLLQLRNLSAHFVARAIDEKSSMVDLSKMVQNNIISQGENEKTRSSPSPYNSEEKMYKLIDASACKWNCWDTFPLPKSVSKGVHSKSGSEETEDEVLEQGEEEEAFIFSPAILITQGRWSHMSAKSGDTEEGESEKDEILNITIDECMINYTLDVRDGIVMFFGSVFYSYHTKLLAAHAAQESDKTRKVADKLKVIQTRKARRNSGDVDVKAPVVQQKVNYDNVFTHGQFVVDFNSNSPYAATMKPSAAMMAVLNKQAPIFQRTPSFESNGSDRASRSRFEEQVQKAGRRTSVSNYIQERNILNLAKAYDNGEMKLNCTEDEDEETQSEAFIGDLSWVIELRWPQVKLISGDDAVLLAGESAEISTKRKDLPAVDFEDNEVTEISIAGKIVNTIVREAQLFVLPNPATASNGPASEQKLRNEPVTWTTLRDASTQLCVTESLSDYNFHFNTGANLEINELENELRTVTAEDNKSEPDTNDLDNDNNSEVDLTRVAKVTKGGKSVNDFKLVPAVSKLYFTVSDTNYSIINNTSTSIAEGVLNIPANIIVVDIPEFEIKLTSSEFFVISSILRNLLLVPPSQDYTAMMKASTFKQVDSIQSRERKKSNAGAIDVGDVDDRPRSLSASPTNRKHRRRMSRTSSYHSRSSSLDDTSLPRLSDIDNMINDDDENENDDENLPLDNIEETEIVTPKKQLMAPAYFDADLVEQAIRKIVGSGNNKKVIEEEVCRLVGKHEVPVDKRERRIMYSIKSGKLVLVEDEKDRKDRVVAKVDKLNGLHSFDMLDCTNIQISIEKISLLECTGQKDILSASVGSSSSDKPPPFLQFKAVTAPPLLLGNTKVNIYNHFQIQLYPGIKFYQLNINLTKETAYFLSSYFVDEADDEGGNQVNVKSGVNNAVAERNVKNSSMFNVGGDPFLPVTRSSIIAQNAQEWHKWFRTSFDEQVQSTMAAINVNVGVSTSTIIKGKIVNKGRAGEWHKDSRRKTRTCQLRVTRRPDKRGNGGTVDVLLEFPQDIFFKNSLEIRLMNVKRISFRKEPENALEIKMEDSIFTLLPEDSLEHGRKSSLKWVAAIAPTVDAQVIDEHIRQELMDEDYLKISYKTMKTILEKDDSLNNSLNQVIIPERKVSISRYNVSRRGATVNHHRGSEKEITKAYVYFQYLRTSMLNVNLNLQHVPVNLFTANGLYRLQVSELKKSKSLTTWNRLAKEYRNSAIKSLIQALIYKNKSAVKSTESPPTSPSSKNSKSSPKTKKEKKEQMKKTHERLLGIAVPKQGNK